jgi:hypothetical protein
VLTLVPGSPKSSLHPFDEEAPFKLGNRDPRPAVQDRRLPLRKGRGLVDAPGRWLVGTKGESPHCPVLYLPSAWLVSLRGG